MSNDVLDWGNKSALAFGQSKQQALEAAGTFGNLFTSMGLANGKSADMSKGLVELAADLASFNNIDPALVLEKLRSGLVGEVEPLRTLGINLTMAATKAKAVQMGLAGANALILEQSSNAQGDFARTADGMANQSRIMSAQLKDSAAMLGQNLLPIALKVVQGLNKMLETFNNAPPFVQKGILVFMGFLAVLGPLLSVLGSVISFLSGVSTIAGSLGISLSAVAAGAGSAITALIGIGGAALSLLGSILLLAAGPVLLYLAFKNNFMGITDTVKQLWFIIKFYFSQIAKWIVDSFRKINLIEIGRNMLQGFANGIMSAIPLIVAAAKNAGTAAMTAIKGILGIHSPSAEFMKLGAFSGQGFQMGLAGAMDPNLIARTMAKPVQQMNSQSNSNVIHLSNGLTLRDVDALMNEKINRFATRALGGV
jgi:hypothetical protein